ncbi:MAG: tRNA pseudouridine(38-40) synthase TruA [Calditrichaeota bacterium]|nr:MAG: tRNA pseudouridine(38-40) synthase TruA [Calditrichota bacterium]
MENSRRIKLTLTYDGTDFLGWQVQANQVRTVQGVIEEKLSSFLNSKIRIHGSGRTDAGVHAKNQVAHFDTTSSMDSEKMFHILFKMLPKDILLKSLSEVESDFHSRFSAKSRQYVYQVASKKILWERNFKWILKTQVNLEKMNEVARVFLGRQNLVSFCRAKTEVQNYFCDIQKIEILETADGFDFRIKANRFLHSTVRMILGFLIEVGIGKYSSEDLEKILKSDERVTIHMRVAPPQGLFLEEVRY